MLLRTRQSKFTTEKGDPYYKKKILDFLFKKSNSEFIEINSK